MIKNTLRKSPLVSVIIPVYNDKKYLDETIRSILNQTFKDLELILINDASTDKSLAIMKSYQKKDKRIILINNKKNLMTSTSRNKALKIARGKYIVMQDHDDISLPKRIEVEYNFLEKNPDAFLVSCANSLIDENGKESIRFKIINLFNILFYLTFNNLPKNVSSPLFIKHSSIMFRNTGELYYRPKLIYAEDYDLYLRLMSDNKKIFLIPPRLVKYRFSQDMNSIKHFKVQLLMAMKSRQFYRQRLSKGKDSYDDFNHLTFIKKYAEKDYSLYEMLDYKFELFFYFLFLKLLL
ncbi:glycosyltransferase family 2 protein [Candidatus Pacearchaeota archaeon]|nr:glycosyltransferase family 2 protein [Candidatus Pacearchaeota archaeon]